MRENDGVVASAFELDEPRCGIGRKADLIAVAFQLALDEAAQPRIVIDVEEARARHVHTGSGIWITESNKPNRRIASGKS
jgi:hypothetical protein